MQWHRPGRGAVLEGAGAEPHWGNDFSSFLSLQLVCKLQG